MEYEYIKLLSTKNVDNALDEASLNPVQNKVVTEALNEKANRADIPTALADLTDDEAHRTVTDAEKENWNSKATLPQWGTPFETGYSGTIYFDTSLNLAEYLDSLNLPNGSYVIASWNESDPWRMLLSVLGDSGNKEYGIEAFKLSDMQNTGISVYYSDNVDLSSLIGTTVTHTGWQVNSISTMGAIYELSDNLISDNGSTIIPTSFMSKTPFVKPKGGIFLGRNSIGEVDWINGREAVMPKVESDGKVTPLAVGDVLNTIYFDTSRDIDEDLAGLTYDGEIAYVATFGSGGAILSAYLPAGTMGNTEPVYAMVLMLVGNNQILLYISSSTPPDILTQFGATHTGWQIDSYAFTSADIVDTIGAESIDYISSTPCGVDYKKGLFLRITSKGEYKWESPFPEARRNLSVGENLPNRMYFDTTINVESYFAGSLNEEGALNLIEVTGFGAGAVLVFSQNGKTSICAPYSNEEPIDGLEGDEDFIICYQTGLGWVRTSVDYSNHSDREIVALNGPTEFITRDATAEEYEKGLYLKVLADGRRVWTPSAAGFPEGGSADQVLTKTEDGAEWKSLATVATSGSYNDLINKPTNVSSFTNDAGYLTEHQDISGKADLVDGKVPTAQLPSYVDDVLEYDTYNSLPATGENGKIYVALDTNRTYRWGGSTYVEISASLTLGTTSATAYRGDYGEVAYQHSQTTSGNPHNVKYSDLTDAPALIIPVTEDTTNSTAGAWKGTATGITSYYTGLTIIYKLPANGGATSTSLNINELGAQTVFLHDLVWLTNEYIAGDTIILRYDEAFALGGGGWGVVGALNTSTKLRIGDSSDWIDYTDYYTNRIVYTPNPDATYTYTYPTKSGTLATTDDVVLCHHSVVWTYTSDPTNLGGTTYQDKYELYIDFYDRNPSAYKTLSAALVAAVKQGATRSVTGIKTSIEDTATTHYSIYNLNRSASDEYSVAYNSSDYKGSALLTSYLSLSVTDTVTTI